MNKRNLRPVELGLVVCSREFFNAAPALETRKQLLAQLDRLNIGYITMPVDATKNGAVQSRDDARRYAAYFRERRDHVDGLVVCLPNFGDEIAISELVNEARLNVPILLQASNDEIDKVDVKSRRDAFCGKISVTTISISMACLGPIRRLIPATSTAPSSPPTWTGSCGFAGSCAA